MGRSRVRRAKIAIDRPIRLYDIPVPLSQAIKRCAVCLYHYVLGRTFSLRRASLMGRVVRGMEATGWGVLSAMVCVCVRGQLMGSTAHSVCLE